MPVEFTVAAVLATGFIVSTLYSWLMHWFEQRYPGHGFWWLIALIWVILTLALAGLFVPAEHLRWVWLCFAVTGTPQIGWAAYRWFAWRHELRSKTCQYRTDPAVASQLADMMRRNVEWYDYDDPA